MSRKRTVAPETKHCSRCEKESEDWRICFQCKLPYCSPCYHSHLSYCHTLVQKHLESKPKTKKEPN